MVEKRKSDPPSEETIRLAQLRAEERSREAYAQKTTVLLDALDDARTDVRNFKLAIWGITFGSTLGIGLIIGAGFYGDYTQSIHMDATGATAWLIVIGSVLTLVSIIVFLMGLFFGLEDTNREDNPWQLVRKAERALRDHNGKDPSTFSKYN